MSSVTHASFASAPPQRTPGPAFSLALVRIDQQGLVLIDATGRITASEFPVDGRDPFESVLGVNWSSQRILINLSGVEYVDSFAIGWLINTHRAFKAAGGRLIIHSIQPNVRQIFDLLKVGRVLTLSDDEPTARATATGGAA